MKMKIEIFFGRALRVVTAICGVSRCQYLELSKVLKNKQNKKIATDRVGAMNVRVGSDSRSGKEIMRKE